MKILGGEGKLPIRGSKEAAGYDIFSLEIIILAKKQGNSQNKFGDRNTQLTLCKGAA